MSVHFDLLADTTDYGGESMFVNEIALHIPQPIEHLRFGQDQPVVFDEEVQGAVFLWGKIYGTAAQRGGLLGEIDPQKAVLI